MKCFVITLIILSISLTSFSLQTEDEANGYEDIWDYDEDYGSGDLKSPDPNDNITAELQDENDEDNHVEWQICKDLRSAGLIDRPFFKKLARNLNPFSSPRPEIHFYLFQNKSKDCGKELIMGNSKSIIASGLNSSLPTRIIIHGWMSQARGSFNRDLKDAYLKKGNFNVIVVDWSAKAANPNYFRVVKCVDYVGKYLAEFFRYINRNAQIRYEDTYLIGHSLGAQIAGAAGKYSRPQRFNTIFALDPAGPKFRYKDDAFRIDPTDAWYVESIQTSRSLGFLNPTGNATFYPNYGIQDSCYYFGCSHIRAYKMFVESINSPVGFYGTKCLTPKPKREHCNNNDMTEYRMGGEPSIPKSGTFVVETERGAPFAKGKINQQEESKEI